jgi:T4 RnlA family RNA ligase
MQHHLPDTYNFYNLYSDMMALCKGGDTFFFADRVVDNVTYRIFNYRLASYTDFCKPNALEARGIMFALTDDNGVVLEDPKLVCRPIRKFFNRFENPLTMDLVVNVDTIERMEVKEDGSLISTFIHKGELRVKSKGSIESEQGIDAMNWINKNPNLKQELFNITKQNFTVDMEWVAPFNRIVLNYKQANLVILHIRCNTTGTLMTKQSVDPYMYPTVLTQWVQDAAQQLSLNYDQILQQFDDLTGIEGFVVYLKDGTIFKLKCEWYLQLHRCKESVDTPRRLFEVAVNEGTDDLRSMFFDNNYVLEQIEKMELLAKRVYNEVVYEVESFVTLNKNLILNDQRKDYAILAKQTLQPHLMSLAMTQYDHIRGLPNREVDYKQFVIKNYKLWGLTDEAEVVE